MIFKQISLFVILAFATVQESRGGSFDASCQYKPGALGLCAVDTDCPENAACSSGTCACNANFPWNTDGVKCESVNCTSLPHLQTNGGYCVPTSPNQLSCAGFWAIPNCQTQADCTGVNQVCTGSTCECITGYYWDRLSMACSLYCTATSVCTAAAGPYSICNSYSKVCQCSAGSSWDPTHTTCIPPPVAIAGGMNTWVTKDVLYDVLPVGLTPLWSGPAQGKVVCSGMCDLNPACSSYAYSDLFHLCQTFSHPSTLKPLPTLAIDVEHRGFQYYYRGNWCPPNWDMDTQTMTCYLASETTPMSRSSAWGVCENNFMSQLAMFQTSQQRNALYSIIQSKYSNVPNYWLGYSQFDDQLWSRPIPYVTGYVVQKGDCGGNDHNFPDGTQGKQMSLRECAEYCDRVVRNFCVTFVYQFTTGRCWPKSLGCNIATCSNCEIWAFHKVHKARPLSTTLSDDASGNDLWSAGTNGATSYNQCYHVCSHSSDTAEFEWNAGQGCMCKAADYFPGTGAGWTRYNKMEINMASGGMCPFGARYRDVCLVPDFSISNNDVRCRNTGGKFLRPTDSRKMDYAFSLTARPNTGYGGTYPWIYLDYQYISGVWQSQYTGMNYTDPAFQLWPWASGQPASPSTTYACAVAGNPAQTATGNTVSLVAVQCNSPSYNNLCEMPLSQSWPMECRFTPSGREYVGTAATTAITGSTCIDWTTTSFSSSPRSFVDGFVPNGFCRSPDDRNGDSGPWCFINATTWETCAIPMCPESDWHHGQTYDSTTTPYSALTQYSSPMVTGNYFDWTVQSITATAAPLCQMAAADASWCPYYWRGHCYTVYPTPANFTNAQSICTGTGGHLVTVASREEYNYLASHILNIKGTQWLAPRMYWAGLQYLSGAWTYVTGESTAAAIALWYGTPPTSGCAGFSAPAIDGNPSRFVGNPCSNSYWFICEIDIMS